MHCTTGCKGSEINRDQSGVVDQLHRQLLASWSSPEVKMTVRGLFGEKSCIQSVGMLLIDLTGRAPTAMSAIISLEVRPFNAARDLVAPARLMYGTGPTCAFVASIRVRPRQSIPLRASDTLTQRVARMTTSHSAACCLVPASAPELDRPQNQPAFLPADSRLEPRLLRQMKAAALSHKGPALRRGSF